MTRPPARTVEALGVVLAAVLAVGLGEAALAGMLERAAHAGGEVLRAPDEVLAGGRRALGAWLLGTGLLLAGRWASWRRGGERVGAPALLPAVVALSGLGLAVQLGYGDPVHRAGWTGPGFGQGWALAGLLAGGLLALPASPADLVARAPGALLVGAGAVLGALALVGTGPAGTDTRILLFGVQPLELVKLALAWFLGEYLGRRAGKLRWQRDGGRWLRWPRPRLLVPAVVALAGTSLGLVVVRDLGPTLVLALVFLTAFYAVTRSAGWVLLALALVGAAGAGLVGVADALPGTVGTRVRMWTDPWLNAVPGGDQLARARWAVAAGGLLGQGAGAAPVVGALPAGHTDLVFAHLVEELGAVGGLVTLALLGAVAGSGLRVAALARTPERQLVALCLSALFGAQVVVILGGTLGLLPLTGIVVPFLSSGRASQVAFALLAAALVRLADDGPPRVDTEVLRELRAASRRVALAGAGALALLGAVVGVQAVVLGPGTSARGVVARLGDGTVRVDHDPRLEALVRAMPRGPLLDRGGRPLAATAPDGRRVHPLGAALGTVLGAPAPCWTPPGADGPRCALRPPWALERAHDARLRGVRPVDDGPAAWRARVCGEDRFLVAVPSLAPEPAGRARAEVAAARHAEACPGDVHDLRLVPLEDVDLSAWVPLLRLPAAVRRARVAELAADEGARAVPTTLDADLQAAAAQVVREAAGRGLGAAAVVVDVDTGHVLARAQWPDVDLGAPGALDPLLPGAPPEARARFHGAYGPWPDKTGLRGVVQAGSVAKVFTALAAARTGAQDARFACVERGVDGPSFTRSGWLRPVHDHPRDPLHGEVDLARGLAVSCNVYFGQLGLQLGPQPFHDLIEAGVEAGWPDARGAHHLPVGAPGSRALASTAFGQGAAALSVQQAARLVAAVASGGTYRRCDPALDLHAPCDERPLGVPGDRLVPILEGMRRVMEDRDGTGRGLRRPAGLRVYGKTGTADAVPSPEEAPWAPALGRPHAWFVGFSEPASTPPDQPHVPGRVAVAVVVFRGGSGASAAGPAAMKLLEAARASGAVVQR